MNLFSFINKNTHKINNKIFDSFIDFKKLNNFEIFYYSINKINLGNTKELKKYQATCNIIDLFIEDLRRNYKEDEPITKTILYIKNYLRSIYALDVFVKSSGTFEEIMEE